MAKVMLANQDIASPGAIGLPVQGVFAGGRILRTLVLGLVGVAALFGALQTAACSDSSVQREEAVAGAKTDATKRRPLIEVRYGPLIVPVPEGDTEGSPFRPLPAPPAPASPMAIVPGISVNVVPTALDRSQPASVQ